MFKQTALAIYRDTFGDEIMPPFLDERERDWQAYADQLARRVGSRAALAQFWGDVKSLAWPETYGATPWDFAGSAGFALANCGGRVPAHLLDVHGRAVQRFLDQLA